METHPPVPRPDRVFVIRLWHEDGETRSNWLAEVKEIGTVRTVDRRRVVDSLPTAFSLILRWLEQAPKSET
jgi:hypothetical protein